MTTGGEKVFDNSRDRWRGYSVANLATLHGIGAARYFLDRIHGLAPTLHDTHLLRYYVPAFFTGLTASLDCLALEIHLLVCLDDPSLSSVKKVGFSKKHVERLKSKLECAAQCRPQEAACIERLRKWVVRLL